MRFRTSLLVASLCVVIVSPQIDAAEFGSFVGDVVAKWLDDGRRMQLQNDFAYVDPAGKRWNAPRDSIVDGASIPRVFWAAIGGPFEGQYRNASVIHDVACDLRNDAWEGVHKMFYYAMRAGGVPSSRAALMYAAVYKFGPRWDKPKGFWATLGERISSIFVSERMASVPAPPASPPPLGPSPLDVKALEELIEMSQPGTPEEVEQLLAKNPI